MLTRATATLHHYGLRSSIRSSIGNKVTTSLVSQRREISKEAQALGPEEGGEKSKDASEEEVYRQNWRERVNLATAYRGMEKYNLQEGVCNHLSCLTPSLHNNNKDVMLIVPYGYYWGDVTPECFIGIDLETDKVVEGSGNVERSGRYIHSGIYQKRKNIRSIMHSHAQYSLVLACLEDPRMKNINQNTVRFVDNVAYDMHYDDVPGNVDNDECARIAQQLGEDKQVMLMGHHGLLTVANSVALAFDLHYYFEQAAKSLVRCYQTGKPIKEMNADVAREVYEEVLRTEEFYAQHHLRGIRHTLMREDSSFVHHPVHDEPLDYPDEEIYYPNN